MRRESTYQKMLPRVSIPSQQREVNRALHLFCSCCRKRREKWLRRSSSSFKRAAQPEPMYRGLTSSSPSAGDATPLNWSVFSISISIFFFLLLLSAVALVRARSTSDLLIPSTSMPLA
ncbi:hypothetical protein BT93_G2242 [Corymbia citriodora subsp. variegata]|nr:hypothetical protein BT93_G2242 [Corymbia citriodora subsp. variegata]